jgi:chromosome segregation ATPase
MSDVIQVRPSEIIAAEINSIKEQTRRTFLYNSIEIGRRLAEAKQVVPHGEWGTWLVQNVDYSQTTANNLLKIFDQYSNDQLSVFGDNLKSQAFENLSYSQAVALLGVPEEEREAFVQDNDVENMSTRELQQAIKEKKEIEEQLKQKEKETAELEKKQKAHDEVVKRLEADIESAKQSGNEEDVEKLRNRISELETELKAKPIDVPATVEKIPEEIEAELTELRKKASQPNSTSTVKFKLHFESLVSRFKELLATLDEVKQTDPEEHEKYKNAVTGLLEKMSERL